MNIKIIAIFAVIVVVVAGIGAVLMMNGSETYRSDDDTGRLMVYGNANNDDYLDNDDIKALEDIINGDMEKTPLSDANQDGVVDKADIEWVKRMVNREKMDIYYQYSFSGERTVKTVSYPLSRIVLVGVDITVTLKAIGGENKIVGMHGGALDDVLFSDLKGIPKISSSLTTADLELVSQHNVDAIITHDTQVCVPNESMFVAAGIDVIRIATSDAESLAGVLTVGYFLQREDQSHEYVRFCDEIVKELENKVGAGKIKDSDRKTAFNVVMTNSLSGTISTYYAATELAGAKNLADWNTTTRNFPLGDEWLFESKYDADYIIHMRSMGYGSVDKQNIWNTYSIYFADTNTYNDGNYVIVNLDMPICLRLAYMASIFYPDIFGEDWGDKKNQEFVDRFTKNLSDRDYDVVSDGTFFIKANMVNS